VWNWKNQALRDIRIDAAALKPKDYAIPQALQSFFESEKLEFLVQRSSCRLPFGTLANWT
jgi:hypothetical protein